MFSMSYLIEAECRSGGSEAEITPEAFAGARHMPATIECGLRPSQAQYIVYILVESSRVSCG